VSRRAICLRLGVVGDRPEPLERRIDHREHDLVLGLELVVDGRLRDAEPIGDHLQRRAAHAVLGKQVERRGQQPLASRAGPVLVHPGMLSGPAGP